MIHWKPPLFIKITPVDPDVVTVVDLGGEMGHVEPAVATSSRHMRHTSLPPSPTRAEYDRNAKAIRHGSLPPNLPTGKSASPVEDSIEEMGDEIDNSDDSERAGVT